MSRRCAGVALLLWIASLAVVVGRQEAPAAPVYRPPPAPAQPIAFSHKQHVATQSIDCLECHATATKDDHATLPPTSTCVECHRLLGVDTPEIRKFLAVDASKEPVPWVRVYRLPDYVYFSHKVHASATPSITCDQCHGTVRDMDQTQKVKDISMAACIACHKQRSAPITCGNTCHDTRG